MEISPQVVRCCFTINNFTQEEEELVRDVLPNRKDIIKAIIAEEEHLEEGTPHIQGYIEFKSRKRRNAVVQLLGGRAYVTKAKGSRAQNWAYCSKEGNIIAEEGFTGADIIEGRKLTTSEEKAKDVLEAIKVLDPEEMEAKYPSFMLYHSKVYFEKRLDADQRRYHDYQGDLQKKNIWIYGEPGAGKSFAARQGCESVKIYNHAFNKWWGGFKPGFHTRVIIDDWPCIESGGNILVQHLKIWGDRYIFQAEVKGGSLMVEPGSIQIVITSQYKPEECFTSIEDMKAIKRRFKVIHMEKTSIDEITDPFEEEEGEEDDSIIEE